MSAKVIPMFREFMAQPTVQQMVNSEPAQQAYLRFQAMSQTTKLVTLLAVLYITYYTVSWTRLYIRRRKLKKLHGCKPSYARSLISDITSGIELIFRLLKARLQNSILETLGDRVESLGPTSVFHLFHRLVVLTNDRENIKCVLNDNFNDYLIGERISTMGRLLGAGIFTTDGHAWKNSRALVKPSFDRKQVADLDMLERHIRTLIDLIPKDGTTIDLQPLFFRLTIDSATELLFGESDASLDLAKTQGFEKETEFSTAFNYSQASSSMRIQIDLFSHLYYSPKENRYNSYCRNYVAKFVDHAIEMRKSGKLDKKSDKYVFLHELTKQTLERERLINESLNVLLAGRDTTASLISMMFFLLSRNPRVWKKLQEEIAELGREKPNYETLRNLTYLRHCLQETLRLYPVVPLNFRTSARDTVLPLGGGKDGKSPLFVPAGTRVAYSPYLLHRRKDYFGDNAEVFLPERWETLRQNWAYIPFNGGPRICVGQQYALTEAGYTTVRLMQEFSRIESRDYKPWMENFGLTMCSHNGTKVGLWQRAAHE